MDQEAIYMYRVQQNFDGEDRFVCGMQNQRSLLWNVSSFFQQSVDHQMFVIKHGRDLPVV